MFMARKGGPLNGPSDDSSADKEQSKGEQLLALVHKLSDERINRNICLRYFVS